MRIEAKEQGQSHRQRGNSGSDRSKSHLMCQRIKSTPGPDTFEKYRSTPPISSAILLQEYVLLLAENSFAEVLGSLEHPHVEGEMTCAVQRCTLFSATSGVWRWSGLPDHHTFPLPSFPHPLSCFGKKSRTPSKGLAV